MKKLQDTFVFFLLVAFLFMLPFLSDFVKEAVTNGIDICLRELIPSLFPFLFFSSLLSSLAKDTLAEIFAPLFCPLFKISKSAVPAAVLGILGGFPTGSAVAAKLYRENKISKSEAERLPVFSNNAGIMFTLGTIGSGHFSSFKTGLLIYALHIFSSVIAGLFTRGEKSSFKESRKDSPPIPDSALLPGFFISSIRESVYTMGFICGNFIIFRVVSRLISLIFGEGLLSGFLSGLLEVTGGVLSMPASRLGLCLTAFLLSFNGLCVHMQSLSFFAPLKLSLKKTFCWKIFSAFLSSFLMYLTLPENLLSENSNPSVIIYIIAVFIPTSFALSYLFSKKRGAVN